MAGGDKPMLNLGQQFFKPRGVIRPVVVRGPPSAQQQVENQLARLSVDEANQEEAPKPEPSVPAPPQPVQNAWAQQSQQAAGGQQAANGSIQIPPGAPLPPRFTPVQPSNQNRGNQGPQAPQAWTNRSSKQHPGIQKPFSGLPDLASMMDNPTPQEAQELADYQFPGTEGKKVMIRTNLFPISYDQDVNVGVYQLEGYHVPNEVIHTDTLDKYAEASRLGQTINPTFAPIHPMDLVHIFFQHFNSWFMSRENPRILVRGYPVTNQSACVIYVVPPIPVIRDSIEFRTKDERRALVVGLNQVKVKFLRIMKLHSKYEDKFKDFRQMMKAGMIEALPRMFKNQGYSRIGNDIFTQLGKHTVGNVIDILAGMKVRIHTEVPKRPMLSINLTFTSSLRTCVPLLYVYSAMILGRNIDEVQFQLSELNVATIERNIQLELFRKVVQNLKIKIPFLQDHKVYGRVQLVDISIQPGNTLIVDNNRNGPVTLNEHYTRIGYPVTLPLMNAVCIKRGARRWFVPMEHCFVDDTPQKLRQSIHLFRREIVKLTAVPPNARFDQITHFRDELNLCLRDPKTPINIMTKLKIDLKPAIILEGRVLPQPETNFVQKPGDVAIPYAQKPVRYVFLNLRPEDEVAQTETLKNYVKYLYEKRGIYFSSSDALFTHHFRHPANQVQNFKNVIGHILEKVEKNRLKFDKETEKLFFFILLPNEDYKTEFYTLGKNMLIKAGFPSGNVFPSTFDQLHKPRVRFNLSLKINAKLGGTNCVITDNAVNVHWNDFIKTPTMFMGIDTRNSPYRGQRGIVAVTISKDKHASNYHNYVRKNHEVSRYSCDWRDIITHGMDNWKEDPPVRIFIFRAGVAEEQLTTGEALSEITEIKDQVKKYWEDRAASENRAPIKAPKITYIGFNDAHNVRFALKHMPTDQIEKEYLEQEELKYNLARGTVIDHMITGSNTFYLITHAVYAGTVLPSKYTVVTDENKIKVNTLLSVVYTMCCLSARSNVPVRRPLPIALCQFLLNRMVDAYGDVLFDNHYNGRDVPIHEDLRGVHFYV